MSGADMPTPWTAAQQRLAAAKAAIANADDKLAELARQAKILSQDVREGYLPGSDVVDALSEQAHACGVVALYGWDAVQHHLSEGVNGALFRADERNGAAPPRHSRPTRRHFKLVPFAAITISQSPPYLIKGLIPRSGLIVAWGPPKCGKSFWTFDLTMHIALGWGYRGRRVQQGAVVYLALEGGDGFKARVEAFRQHHSITDAPFFLVTDRTNLIADHPAIIAAIRKQIGKLTPAIVVIDTLNRSLAGSESKDEDMAAYVRAADAIRESFACAVMIVHHCGVDGSRPRGHTSLTGAADAQLAVKRDTADNIIVEVEWLKDGTEGDTIVSTLQQRHVGTDQDGEPITSCVILPADDTSATSPTKVPPSVRIALDLLREAVAEEGQSVTNSHVTPHVKTVPISLWRNYCYNGTVTDSDDPRAKRQAFGRAAKKLQQLNLIGVWNDLVWLAEKPGVTGVT